MEIKLLKESDGYYPGKGYVPTDIIYANIELGRISSITVKNASEIQGSLEMLGFKSQWGSWIKAFTNFDDLRAMVKYLVDLEVYFFESQVKENVINLFS